MHQIAFIANVMKTIPTDIANVIVIGWVVVQRI